MRPATLALTFSLVIVAGLTLGSEPKVGERLVRTGDEFVAAGQFFHVGTPVVTFLDPGGYDAYRLDHRFASNELPAVKEDRAEVPKPFRRFGMRKTGLSQEELERVRGGGWDLPLLQRTVDQFVIHFDACGTSQKCFQVLHDERGLSVHFMLDLDGTIYQTLDLKEGAWHATKANGRSIGIEIANVGTYTAGKAERIARWYGKDADGKTRITLPEGQAVRDAKAVLRPSSDDPIGGNIQGEDLLQYDLTPQQYASLIKLTAALCKTFPKIRCDYPKGPDGKVLPRKLDDEDYNKYQGILGHYHVQTNKVDPGPAFQWDKLIEGAHKLMGQ
jgi:N-acetyl-anhydromuramyl-L-alanine amidase AmpD